VRFRAETSGKSRNVKMCENVRKVGETPLKPVGRRAWNVDNSHRKEQK